MAGKIAEFKYLQREFDGLFPKEDRLDDHTEPLAPQVDKAIYPNGYVRIQYKEKSRKNSVEENTKAVEQEVQEPLNAKKLSKTKISTKGTLSTGSLSPNKK